MRAAPAPVHARSLSTLFEMLLTHLELQGWSSLPELSAWAHQQGIALSLLDKLLRTLVLCGKVEERLVRTGVWLCTTEYKRRAA